MKTKDLDAKIAKVVQNWMMIDSAYLAAKAKRKDKRLFIVQLLDEIQVRARLLATRNQNMTGGSSYEVPAFFNPALHCGASTKHCNTSGESWLSKITEHHSATTGYTMYA